MNRRSLLCVCAVYAHARAVSLGLLEYIKINHRSDAFYHLASIRTLQGQCEII